MVASRAKKQKDWETVKKATQAIPDIKRRDETFADFARSTAKRKVPTITSSEVKTDLYKNFATAAREFCSLISDPNLRRATEEAIEVSIREKA